MTERDSIPSTLATADVNDSAIVVMAYDDTAYGPSVSIDKVKEAINQLSIEEIRGIISYGESVIERLKAEVFDNDY